MPHAFRLVGLSDVGRVRARNEDSFRLLADQGLAVVADGMGGHPGGDVASRIAADALMGSLSRALRGGAAAAGTGADGLSSAMARAVLSAHEEIRAQGARAPELNGMGTTVTALVLDAAADTYVVGHVGDSRGYRLRDGKLTALTRDQTWVQERIDAGELTADEARRHPHAHILTQCLGLEDVPTPQIAHGRVLPGDAFLLCTDGLVGMLTDAQIEVILTRELGNAGDEAALAALLDAANAAGGLDNVTAVLLTVAAGEAAG